MAKIHSQTESVCCCLPMLHAGR